MRIRLFPATLCILPGLAAAVEIDGRIGPGEWDGARHVTDFRLTQPLSREPAPQPTQAWIKATPEGLALAFRSEQSSDIPRRRQRLQRDQGGAIDRVNLYVDFDGDGRTGFNFTVAMSGSIQDGTITSESRFSNDWDAVWLHAATEDEAGWTAEMLIPWHVAPMRAATGGTRTIRLAIDRVIGATGERMTWPAVSFTEPRFLSVFQPIDVPVYSQSLLAVTPYVVAVHDRVRGGNEVEAGGDLFWKPNGQFQLSATFNPDFGQVESDELVVNFGAVETFFSDKRPFFTENQGIFDVPFGSPGNANRLLYTRRVGAVADDGRGAADVLAAAKLNGSAGGINYGVFAAAEADGVGRDFYALRATRDFERHGLGAMLTHVERPFLDRVATVAAIDHRWTPNTDLSVLGTLVGSRIEQGGTTASDAGAQVRIDHLIGDGWRQQLYAVHLGDALQLNDFGFLERNDWNYARYELVRRFSELPEASPFSSHEWRGAVSRRMSDGGLHIADAWAINRRSERRDGGSQSFEVAGWTAGHDDLVTRGNGVVRVPEKLFLFAERDLPRRGRWGFYGSARYTADGLGGADDGGATLRLRPVYFVSDSASIRFGLQARRTPDWLLWRRDRDGAFRLGTFDSDMLSLDAAATWLVDDRQELRVRLEAIGLDARAKQSYALAADGTPVRLGVRHDDFGLRTMGFQVRYRYELAPLSHLYVAYVRGGSSLGNDPFTRYSAADELREAFELRDSEQLLVKLAYRFEI